jgi:PAS domain S-box-containing protein
VYWGSQSIVPLIAFLCYGALLALVVTEGLYRPVIRFFTFYLLTMLVWSFGAFMMYMNPPNVVLWNRVMLGGLLGMPAALFGFTRAFLHAGRQARWLYWALAGFFILLLVDATGYLADHVRVAEDGLIEYEFGPGVFPLAFYFVTLVGSSGLSLIRGLRQVRDPVERNRMTYALLGLGAVVFGSTTNLVPRLGAYPLDIAANIANAMLLAYAIGRYQLLDIRLVIRRGLLYSILTAVIGSSYLLLVLLATTLFHAPAGPGNLIIPLLVALIAAVAMQPLRNAAQSLIDRLFFREKYDAGLMLQKLSRTTTSVLDLDQLTDMVLHEITSTMHVGTAALFLRQANRGDLLLVAQRGLDKHRNLRLKSDHPVVAWLSDYHDALTTHDLEVLPQFKALWEQERQDLERMEAAYFVPLVARAELIGVLIVGPKLSDMPYSLDDRLTLTTLANQVAVAVQNAWLYEEVVREKRRTETIVEETFAGIVVVDREMRILVVNPGAEAITGYSSQELVGRPLPEVLGTEVGYVGGHLYRAILTGQPAPPTEARIRAKEGARDILFGTASLGDLHLFSFTDITRLKEVDRLKTNIVANVSHELRTPLASVKAYAELLLDSVGSDDLAARRHFLSIIAQKTDILSGLISDLLDLARLESGEFEMREEAVSVPEIISASISLLEMEMLAKNISVDVDASSVPLLIADRALMTIIVENLISNAVKFSHEGGQVDVVARHGDGQLVLTVVDHGMGIAPEELPYIFQKFRRLRSAREREAEGTGLGLALVKEAVEVHGGNIDVQSDVGDGCCFCITLPLKPSPQEQTSPHHPLPAARGVARKGARQ